MIDAASHSKDFASILCFFEVFLFLLLLRCVCLFLSNPKERVVQLKSPPQKLYMSYHFIDAACLHSPRENPSDEFEEMHLTRIALLSRRISMPHEKVMKIFTGAHVFQKPSR